jgi:hypothetical protein
MYIQEIQGLSGRIYIEEIQAPSHRPSDYEEKNNGYVAFKWNIHGSARKEGGFKGGGTGAFIPHPYLKQASGQIFNIRRRERFSLHSRSNVPISDNVAYKYRLKQRHLWTT